MKDDLMSKENVSDFASVFIVYWVIPYEIPPLILVNKGALFVSELFEMIFALFEPTNLTTNEYILHGQIGNGKTSTRRLLPYYNVSLHNTSATKRFMYNP